MDTKGTLDFSPPHMCLIRFLVLLGFGGASAWAKGLVVEKLDFEASIWDVEAVRTGGQIH